MNAGWRQETSKISSRSRGCEYALLRARGLQRENEVGLCPLQCNIWIGSVLAVWNEIHQLGIVKRHGRPGSGAIAEGPLAAWAS